MSNVLFTRVENEWAKGDTYSKNDCGDVGMDNLRRGLCLPSENKMIVEQQNKVIEIIKNVLNKY